MIYGTNSQTGQYIAGLDHIAQSITDILTTPLNSRVMFRGYGCGLFELIDSPMNAEIVPRITRAVYIALSRWEPRVSINKVSVDIAQAGLMKILLIGTLTDSNINYQQTVLIKK